MARKTSWIGVGLVVLGSVVAAVVLAEVYLSYHESTLETIPFYNKLYPYVMFRPIESAAFESAETYAMSHNKSRVFHYTNADGFRVPSLDYKIPKEKPAGQLRVAFLGSSAVELGSTFDTTLPGSLRTVLRKQYPGRDIEVINCGIQSAVSRQSIAQLLFSVVEYHPDIVILYDGVNDIGVPFTYEPRENFPYNFQVLEKAWDSYREQSQESLFRILLARSHLYKAYVNRFRGEEQKGTQIAGPGGVPISLNVIPARRFIDEPGLVKDHIAAYLSNWRKLIELSKAYDFRPVCIFQPTGGLDRDYALPLMMQAFNLSHDGAVEWEDAFTVLFREASREIEGMKGEYPGVVFRDYSTILSPSKPYFWDMVHVYDETNMLLAERMAGDIRPLTEAGK